MNISKYQAGNLKEAINKARAELGPEAKIIHVRQLEEHSDSDANSSGSQSGKIEIIAAIDDDQDDDPQMDAKDDPADESKSPKDTSSAYDMLFLRNLEEQIPDGGGVKQSQPRFRRRSIFKEPVSPRKIQPRAADRELMLQEVHRCCSRNQVNHDIIYEILSLLSDRSSPETPRGCISSFIDSRVNLSGGLDSSRKTAIFIGPTGVGKTTTLAKLAAQYRFQHQKAVGLVTIDAYRIAAINQLKTYAQIMSIPLKVALTPEELRRCISDYDEMDLVLVDTPGRSQFNTDALSSLEDFLEAAQPADTHLLITVSSREKDAYSVIDKFAPDHVRQIIFTKLDETSAFGTILNVCNRTKKPVSYLTTGQNVPDDIEVAQVDRIADMFVNARYSTPGSGY